MWEETWTATLAEDAVALNPQQMKKKLAETAAALERNSTRRAEVAAAARQRVAATRVAQAELQQLAYW